MNVGLFFQIIQLKLDYVNFRRTRIRLRIR